jgi:hypothetical protein
MTPIKEDINEVRAQLCKTASESQQRFYNMQDWMGLLEQRNKPMEELWEQIKCMNAEAHAIHNPLE